MLILLQKKELLDNVLALEPIPVIGMVKFGIILGKQQLYIT